MYAYGYGLVTAGSCNVSPALASQWRNGDHWHVTWPEDSGCWCFETEAEGLDRWIELVGWAREAALESASRNRV